MFGISHPDWRFPRSNRPKNDLARYYGRQGLVPGLTTDERILLEQTAAIPEDPDCRI